MDPNTPLTGGQQTFAKILGVLTGLFALTAGGAGLFFAWPLLAGIVFTTVGLVGVIAAVLFLWFLLTSDRVRQLGKTVLTMTTLKSWEWIYGNNPTLAMRAVIEQMHEILEKCNKAFMNSERNRMVLDRQIGTFQKELEESLARLNVAEQNGDEVQANIESAKISTRRDAIAEMMQISDDLKAAQYVVGKHRDQARMVLETTEDRVKVMITTHGAATAAGASLELSLELIDKNSDLARQLAGPMDLLQREIGESLGSIRSAMEDTTGTLQQIEFGNSVSRHKAKAALHEWRVRNGIATSSDSAAPTAAPQSTPERRGALASALNTKKTL